MMPIFKIKNKYYTRIRWVTDYNDMSEVKFPLGTDDKLVAEHRRDTIQFTSLDLLPIKYRTVIVLRDVQELSYEQISHILDCPTGTVKSRVNRARLRLQALLRQWHIEV